jgi:hypothetical protein
MRPDEPAETIGIEFKTDRPTNQELKNVFAAIFGSADFDGVRVFADFKGGADYRALVAKSGPLEGWNCNRRFPSK